MNINPVEAEVHESGEGSTSLLIRAGDIVVEAKFTELAPCEFPVWASAPVFVEIPPGRRKDFVVVPYTGSVTEKTATGLLPDVIKLPVYQAQRVCDVETLSELTKFGGSPIATKVPMLAVAAVCSGVVDGKLVQNHNVLPIWNDGSSVLVRLDWFEGEPAEGTPNPEWHLSASSGVSALEGLRRLAEVARLPLDARHSRFQIHMSPWLLGAELLEDKGQETAHRIWQREWCFDDVEPFSAALTRVIDGLRGHTPEIFNNLDGVEFEKESESERRIVSC